MKQPTLVITGTEDIMCPPANASILAGRINGSRLVRIEDGGHGLMYQYPEKFGEILLSFLG
ncbi:MAG: alpha/beta hydrolase [Candidatus Tritonobacter lacicola]|nr:alpha/beta hydrolase [Candidatus Tritonobacter lacicola]